ncbi:MAG: hypothetical protein BGO39_23970 [Chloroflexi bacterium 54-19]|nr:MAG: hypothetical protein BGO39_23970 [Chloroflexi bacterium 54-19]
MVVLTLIFAVTLAGCGETSPNTSQVLPSNSAPPSVSATSIAIPAAPSVATGQQSPAQVVNIDPTSTAPVQKQNGTPAALVVEGKKIDWKPVDAAMGKPGAKQPVGIYNGLNKMDLKGKT